MTFVTRRKSIDALGVSARKLKPSLSWPHLVALGVGAIVGTGIYTLTGIGAGLAGPAVILSFALCGVICACAALCYAEMSTILNVSVKSLEVRLVRARKMLQERLGRRFDRGRKRDPRDEKPSV